MKLVRLNGDAASLEMQPDELQFAIDALKASKRRIEATFDVFAVGTDEVILLDEWDDPCLISSTASGTAWLEALLSKWVETVGGTDHDMRRVA